MNKVIMSLAAAAALAATVPAFAQQKAPEPKPAAAATPAVAIPKNTFYKGQGPTQYLAKDRLIGIIVYNTKGERVGDIEDLIMGTGSNDVQGVIVGVGGFLGAGEKKIGVRYTALKADTRDGKKVMILDASKEVLAAIDAYGRTEPKKTVLEKAKDAAQKAGEVAKDVAKKATDATKGAVEKAKEAAKPKTN